MHIILGTQSPRRKEIFEFFNIPFSVCSSSYDEEQIPYEGNPKEYVERLSKEKNKCLKKDFPLDVIITADTTVAFKGKVYNKPKDKKEAFSFLKELVGNTHEVYTGVCVSKENFYYTDSACTKVAFQKITDEQIEDYLNLVDPLDKAGSYAIQGPGSLMISRIEGCYYNVMGLPIYPLVTLLEKVGINLWKPKNSYCF